MNGTTVGTVRKMMG